MTISVALTHRTRYRFDRHVKLWPHEIRLRPAAHSRTPILSYSLKVTPSGKGNHFLNWQQDPFGNWVARLVFPDKADWLEVTVDLIADMTVINPFDFFIEEFAQDYPFVYPEGLKRELAIYLEAEPATPLLAAWLTRVRNEFLNAKLRTIDMLVGLNRLVQQDINYVVNSAPAVIRPGCWYKFFVTSDLRRASRQAI